MRTGAPIVYTSADSVFQIAAHEDVIPVPELYRMCEIAYELAVEGLGLGRVIARPFVGDARPLHRTANRHDYAMPPRGETLLDRLAAHGIPVQAIGKITDLFAGRGVTSSVHTANDDEVMDAVIAASSRVARRPGVRNLVDFDTQYGHRNDVAGYAANLERFDARLAEAAAGLAPDGPAGDHSRSRQRSDHAEHGSLAGARAAAGRRPGGAGRA